MKYLTAKETELLFRQVYQDNSRHRKRNIAIFELTKYCALRVSEISQFKIMHYDRDTHKIYCPRLKGSKSNTLKVVDPYVRKALHDYLDERVKYNIQSDYLFISQKGTRISRQRLDILIKSYCMAAKGIHSSKWHMHVLKHTRAIELAEQGFDIDDIQFWLGHVKSENTFKYLEYTTHLHNQLFMRLSQLENGVYKSRY